MEIVPGKELRSWQHPFLFQWLPSSDLAPVSVGFRAEKRWFPIILTLQPGMLSALGAWYSASRSICWVWPKKTQFVQLGIKGPQHWCSEGEQLITAFQSYSHLITTCERALLKTGTPGVRVGGVNWSLGKENYKTSSAHFWDTIHSESEVLALLVIYLCEFSENSPSEKPFQNWLNHAVSAYPHPAFAPQVHCSHPQRNTCSMLSWCMNHREQGQKEYPEIV